MADSKVFAAFPAAGAVEHAYDQLSSAILNGVMTAGQRLPAESKLTSILQVSRPTVREALRMLEQAGMVARQRGRYGGWFVAERQAHHAADAIAALVLLERVSLHEIFEARRILETSSAELAAEHRPEQDLDLMRQAIEQVDAAPNDSDTFIRANALFHLALVHASGNGVLTIMMNSIHPLVDQSLRQVALDRTSIVRDNQAHRLILDAVAAGDAAKARTAVERHLTAFRRAVEAARGDLDRVTITTHESRLLGPQKQTAPASEPVRNDGPAWDGTALHGLLARSVRASAGDPVG